MRDRFKTLPDTEAHEPEFEDFWHKATDRWGVDSTKAAELKSRLAEGVILAPVTEPPRPSSSVVPKSFKQPASTQLSDEEEWISERPTIPMLEELPDPSAVTQRSPGMPATSADESPDIIINEINGDIKAELIYLLIEEAVLRIRSFEFESVSVEPGKGHLTSAIAKTIMKACEDEDLLLVISVDANKFTIIKKDGIDYSGREMDEKKGYVFHSLLRNFPSAVTIK